MARLNTPRRRNRDYDDFRETLAAPAPRTYRDDRVIDEGPATVPTDPAYRVVSPVEQLVRIAAGILNTLLALRFIVALFSSNTGNAVTNVIFNATNWLVRPFQLMFGTPPSGGGGFFDLPALAAIVVVTLLSWAIASLVRDYR